MIRRLAPVAFAAALIGAVAFPATASAHGLVGRFDLPIPIWLFGWAAAVVLSLSFLSLAFLWQEPKLEGNDSWTPLPRGIGRALAATPVRIASGAIGVFLLLIVIWSGLEGTQSPATENFAPTFVYIVFWVGLVPVSVLFGDVFRAFNPWGALGGAVAWIASAVAMRPVRAPLEYPRRLGRWPAALGLFLFVWLELAAGDGNNPDSVAIAAIVYSVITFTGMALFGIDTWLDRGEAFSVYFNLFSRISAFDRRDREIGLRPPLTGLTKLEMVPGTVPFVIAMISTVSFDGFSGGNTWQGWIPHINDFFESLGLDVKRRLEATHVLGLVLSVVPIYALYRLGVAGARTANRRLPTRQLMVAFVHSLVPIALAYVAAHYVSFLLLEGQGVAALASDPLGRGWDLFGTADWSIDYGFLAANTVWYTQVALVVAGHVAALTLAHDRALIVYDDVKQATRSQYWMLGVMVGFTSFALWLLSEQNKG